MPNKKNPPIEALARIELVITKANVGQDGRPRWVATTSDTGPDKAGEMASMVLFQDWIERVEKGVVTDFLPDEPRIPFLGVSHYPSLEGYGEAGPTEKMYIDGNRFKAAGVFYEDDEHPIGKALFASICKEQASIKRGEAVEEPMRISAAWWDLKHSHGDFLFTRKNLTDRCPLCAKGQPRHFLEGQLDHWAVTRVPMNPRTDLELEEKSMAAKKTRKEDAASIVGEEMADKLENHSDADVSKADVDAVPDGMVVKAKAKPKAKPKVEKADPKPDVKKADDGMMERPFSGATDFDAARQWISEQDKLNTTLDYWQTFDMVMMNILEAEEGDKMEMMKKAIADFGEQVNTVKAGLSDLTMMSLISKPEPKLVERSEGKMSEQEQTPAAEKAAPQEPVSVDSYQQLKENVEAALANAEMGREEKAEAIQKSFADFGTVVKAKLDTQNPPDVEQLVNEAVAKSVAPVAEKLDLMLAKMNQAPAPAQPVQKSYTHPAEQLSEIKVEKNSIRDIARRSVGLPQ